MKIALVHPYPWDEVRRGGERYLSDLAWYLHGQGHDVDVLTTVPGASRTWRAGGVVLRGSRRLEPTRLRARGVDAVQTQALTAAAQLLRRRYDVVHALTPWGALAGVLSGHRVVYTELGHPYPAYLNGLPGGARAYRAILRRVAAVTALSSSAADAVARCAPVEPVVLPPGVRLDRFRPVDVAPAGPPTIVFMSDASVERKRVDIVIGALDRLAGDDPSPRLQLGGPGDHRWALERLGPEVAARTVDRIDSLGVGGSDDVPERYARASVTVLPSTDEAFGLVLIESLAAGTPVVCSDGSGMRDIVTDEAIGRTFRTGDTADLTDALSEALRLADDPATGDRCRAHAASWDWATAVGPDHEALYERVVGRS